MKEKSTAGKAIFWIIIGVIAIIAVYYMATQH